AVDTMGGLAVELGREAKGLAESALALTAVTEESLREMIVADESDAWALAELTKVREQAGDYKEVFALLTRQAELVADESSIRDLRHRAAEVAREHIGEEERAIEIYESIFEDDPGDVRASSALRELYGKADMPRKLLALLA